jgi:hypothetical protein
MNFEQLPNEILNKIFFYMQHPTAKLIKQINFECNELRYKFGCNTDHEKYFIVGNNWESCALHNDTYYFEEGISECINHPFNNGSTFGYDFNDSKICFTNFKTT